MLMALPVTFFCPAVVGRTVGMRILPGSIAMSGLPGLVSFPGMRSFVLVARRVFSALVPVPVLFLFPGPPVLFELTIRDSLVARRDGPVPGGKIDDDTGHLLDRNESPGSAIVGCTIPSPAIGPVPISMIEEKIFVHISRKIDIAPGDKDDRWRSRNDESWDGRHGQPGKSRCTEEDAAEKACYKECKRSVFHFCRPEIRCEPPIAFRRPCSSAVGVGGHPGMHASTGMTFPIAPREA